jgi:hypothetical protein
VSFLYDNAVVALNRKAAAAAKILAARDARLSAERSRLVQIADWYQSGESLKQIGSRLGASDVTILRWMANEDIPRRKRYGGRRPKLSDHPALTLHLDLAAPQALAVGDPTATDEPDTLF